MDDRVLRPPTSFRSEDFTVSYAPAAVFLCAVLLAWVSGRSADTNSKPRPVVLAGSVGLVSVALSAYLILDRSDKGIPPPLTQTI